MDFASEPVEKKLRVRPFSGKVPLRRWGYVKVSDVLGTTEGSSLLSVLSPHSSSSSHSVCSKSTLSKARL